ncbi:MAG: 2-succinyl-5-enolpyruvyl-6-hydroxy-3-cyclohexene-1-carboxylic-acid synthase [Akkermansia sp.]|nr:2-succinyl-5-enolpyruvyl-6-hydroxy-3-cyclohexene-1-carboxylic-acid synthase [Akkermansia sp.]
MLKQQGISNIVISPGTSHNAMVRSIDEDSFFKTFSVTDERSAAFFAIGIAQELQRPVAIMSTSGTATCNYVSAVTEAFHRNIPLVIITADKHPYFLNQLEDQMINQPPMFNGITKYSVTLPESIKDSRDDWYCRRLLNEAFLEMTHHGTGPIHINVPISYGMFALGDTFTTSKLPEIPLVERLDSSTKEETWEQTFLQLKNKRVLILCGQDNAHNEKDAQLLDTISKGYNCVISTDFLSNLHIERAIEMEKARPFDADLVPNVIISLNGSVVSYIKYFLKNAPSTIEHWLIHEKGTLADPYQKLKYIIESNTSEFLNKMAQYAQSNASSEYYEVCKKHVNEFSIPSLPYSNCYACQKIIPSLPQDSILHLGNSTTVRIAQFFNLHPSVQVFCNRGVHGIDGCMSSFIGQAAVSDKLAFLMLGDLTFFYDMNALWNKYVRKNVRILLFNNGGASLFYYNTRGVKNFPSLDRNAGAAHVSSAKAWAESRGFSYISSTDQEEFDTVYQQFIQEESDKPIIFEVFTDRAVDGETWHSILSHNTPKEVNLKTKIKEKIKNIIK